MKKEFSKPELKTGMRVEYRNGNIRIVNKLTEPYCVASSGGAFIILQLFSNDLTYNGTGGNHYDIVKVYDTPADSWKLFNDKVKGALLWERQEVANEVQLVDGEIYVETDNNPTIFRHNVKSARYDNGVWKYSVRMTPYQPIIATDEQRAKLQLDELKHGYLWDEKAKKLIKFK